MDIKGTRGLLTFWRGGWVPRGPTNNPSHVPAACFDLGQLPPTPLGIHSGLMSATTIRWLFDYGSFDPLPSYSL